MGNNIDKHKLEDMVSPTLALRHYKLQETLWTEIPKQLLKIIKSKRATLQNKMEAIRLLKDINKLHLTQLQTAYRLHELGVLYEDEVKLIRVPLRGLGETNKD